MIRQSNIIYEVNNGVGFIKLNRPESLNALSFEMIETIYKLLKEWKNDEHIALVCLEGEGDKAFCAGGDVRSLYDMRCSNIEEYALKSFSTEYMMDMIVQRYPKPILAYMDGIVMGGGVGISIGSTHRIVTENTKWAMPELNIGLYPDVGSSYFLNKMPGYLGHYLALTSQSIKAEDVLYVGAGDYYINSTSWPKLRKAITDKVWYDGNAKQELDNLMLKFREDLLKQSTLALMEEKINRYFSYNTVEEIIESLDRLKNQGDEWGHKTLKKILSKSPTSLKVTLRQLIEGKKKTMCECFEMELELSMNFMKSGDFFEGVRAVLVDKDQAPKWSPDSLEKVSKKIVDGYFNYEWSNGENPLNSFCK